VTGVQADAREAASSDAGVEGCHLNMLMDRIGNAMALLDQISDGF
jgi:hypothetical protein